MKAPSALWPALLLGLALGAVGLGAGLALGSAGWFGGDSANLAWHIVWEIRLPRSLGAWLGGALLGLAGAVAQGLFRNPLADPYLLGSASGASLGLASALSASGVALASAAWWARLGLTGAAFVGALLAVLLTVALARGVQQSVRLLLAGVVVGVVLGAVTALLSLWNPSVQQAMQGFLLGTTALSGWTACAVMALALGAVLLPSLALAKVLDALTLGEATAQSLGMPLPLARAVLVAVVALATAAAVAQLGLIAFIGLAAPHAVRGLWRGTHRGLLLLSALAGGALLLWADVLARGLVSSTEVPVGVLTAVLGGSYLLWRLRPAGGRA